MIQRKKIMFLFFVGQLITGMVLLFNPIPFDYVLRVTGLFLVIISPLWMLIFKIFRMTKPKEIDKENEALEKKKDEETI